jgi:hypothetical protein
MEGRNKRCGESMYTNERMQDLYVSPNVIGITKSRLIRWVGACETHGRAKKSIHIFGMKTQIKEKSIKTCVGGEIILK